MKEEPKNVTIHRIHNGYVVYFQSKASKDIHKELYYSNISNALEDIELFFVKKFLG